MRRRQMEQLLEEILNNIEVLEYTDDGEEGNIYFDELVKGILDAYAARVPHSRLRDLIKHLERLAR